MTKVYSIPFGGNFLDTLQSFMRQDGKELADIAFVFAGKRPSFYLRQKLSEGAGTPFYSPRFFSIEEFIDFIARKRYPYFADIEYTDAIWLLYQCIQRVSFFAHHPFREKGFGDFFWWGKYLLEFIDHLDRENINNEELRSLEKNARIGYDVPESTNELLTHVTVLREDFHRALREKRCFTGGYKHLCALHSISEAIPEDFEKIYFAGLFALNAVEKRIIQGIWKAGRADIILEGDPSRWPILSNFISFLGAEIESIPCHVIESQSVSIHAGIDTHSEILKTYEILRDSSPERIAVVLPTAEALFPLLSFAIDRINRPYNISLGYPLSRTSLFDLILHVLNAQSMKRKNDQYPTTEYLSVMLHPFVKNLDLEAQVRLILVGLEKLFAEDILESPVANKPFVTLAAMEIALFREALKAPDAFKKIQDLFFRQFEQAETLYDYAEKLTDILEFVLLHTPVRSYLLSGEIFRKTFEALEDLKNTRFSRSIFHDNGAENRRSICDFIVQHLKSMDLPFETKPIEDLEIIGVLESRNISFDTVIMLDVNEGIMPQAKKINPLIPLGIYDILGIPSPEYNEEIYRYYFERLIKSARDIHLFYIDSEEKPRSRYIEQLIWEKELAAKTINLIKVDKAVYKISLHLQSPPPAIEKTEKIQTILKTKTFSSTAIDNYITCPALFYYKQILRFEEKKALGGDIEAIDRGTIIHSLLYDTFDGYLNREITPALYKEIFARMKTAVEKHFEARESSGDYYLFKKITAFKLENFLKKNIDEAKDPFIIKYLETNIEEAMDINGYVIRMKGRIDRIDYYPHTNEYAISDYKTGGTKQYSQNIVKRVDFQSMQSIHEQINSFQLPIYTYLFMNRFGIPLADTNAKLILLRNNDEEDLFGDLAPDRKETIFAPYMEGVSTVIKDILDPARPFAPFDTDSCRMCAFSNLCHV